MNRESLGNFDVVRFNGDLPQRWLLPSSQEMALLDQATIASGITGLQLMKRAGNSIALWLMEMATKEDRFIVLCGPGNNGGDGFVIARTLREHGYVVDIVLASSERYSAECIQQLHGCSGVLVLGDAPQALVDSGAIVASISEMDLRERVRVADVIVDALLGTGQRAAPRHGIEGLVRLVMEERSHKSARIVSVDIPTGIDGDTGSVFETHIVADATLAIECVKRGMLQFPARLACGEIHTISIGLLASPAPEFIAVEGDALPQWCRRAPDTHKGHLGRVVVIGGSAGMPGAATLSALGALRAGAGIVTRISKRGWVGAEALTECICEYVDGNEDCFSAQDIERVCAIIKDFDVVVLGPGLGQAQATGEFMEGVCNRLRSLGKPSIFDADALNLVATRNISLRGIPAIITPHPGEASRLLGRSTESIQADRFSAVRELWERFKTVVVLKGAGTLVRGAGGGRLIPRGTSYLATPGSGDVLAGIIAVCCLRTASLLDAASLGVWIHASAGMRASELTGGTILASEIAEAVSLIVGKLEA